jgi:TetR/AcrR family transcriptional repressor of nem operon
MQKVKNKKAAETEIPKAEAKKTRKRSKSSRDELLTAAMYLFWEKGFAETRVEEVLARAGAHPGTMYYYFKSKDQVLLGVLDKLTEELYPLLLAPVWEKEKDPIERIFKLLARYREAIRGSKFSYGCPVGRLAMEISPEMVEARKKMAEYFEAWSGAVRQCLEAAGKRLPRGLDLRALSRFVLAVMEGGVMQSRAYRSIEPFDQAVAQLRNYFDKLMAEAVSEGGSYWESLRK